MIQYFILASLLVLGKGQCPWDDETLLDWPYPEDDTQDIVISGEGYIIRGNVLARTITVSNNGKLVVDKVVGGISITTSYLYLNGGGSFWVGDNKVEGCEYDTPLDIILTGKKGEAPEVTGFGAKMIAVAPFSTIVMAGVADRLDWTHLTATLSPSAGDQIIDLADDATSWQEGDEIVVASTGRDMNEAEKFTLVKCNGCLPTQVMIGGPVLHTHLVASGPGVDFRAEVGLLSRNIKVHGEMEDACYEPNHCEYFDYDTFGGHIQMLVSYSRADFVGIELFNMGQQFGGNYPIHYHRVNDISGTVVIGNSIHKSFSRCITVHAADGLLLEDNVGYDSLGHCYFLEDGNEQGNIIRHNLGLVTKPALILPSDRDENMCLTKLDDVQDGYVPDPLQDCRSTSTFWIVHPNNTVEDNVAAGSDEIGFFFVFHREPTGPSVGMLEPFHGERTPLGSFKRNTAHSNRRHGFIMDRGVKISAHSESEPAEFLAMQDYARYMPHENRDLSLPRVPAVLSGYNGYRNGYGMFFRGGDVWVEDSFFADNDIGLSMASEATLPYDVGSHQQVTSATFVGDSGLEGRDVTAVPRLVGVEIRDGPILVDGVNFFGYNADADRAVGAIGFMPDNWGQNSPANTIGVALFGANVQRWVAQDFERSATDSDLTQIFYDRDGAVTGQPGAYVVHPGNALMNDGCYSVDSASVCESGSYAQVYVTASIRDQTLEITRGENPAVTLQGVDHQDTSLSTTTFQPVLLANEEYKLTFSPAPSEVTLAAHNMDMGDSVTIAIEYPNSGTFIVVYDEWDQANDEVVLETVMTAGSSLQDVTDDPDGLTYYYDNPLGLLYVKLINRYDQDGYNYCAAEGCQRVHVSYS